MSWRSSVGWSSSASRAPIEQAKASAIDAVPIQPGTRPGIAARPKAITMLPASGSASTSQDQVVADISPRSSRISSTSRAIRRRNMATIRPSPTTTSQAATTMTTSAKTCPSSLPFEREKATSARLPAFSISSRQSRITSGLRRISTPQAPVANSRAESTRYQETSMT